MKYEEVDYINEDNLTTIKVKDYLPKKLEEMEKKGNFICPFEGCDAKFGS